MFPTLKNNAAAGYQDPVRIELLKGAGIVPCRQSSKLTKKRIIFLLLLVVLTPLECSGVSLESCSCVVSSNCVVDTTLES